MRRLPPTLAVLSLALGCVVTTTHGGGFSWQILPNARWLNAMTICTGLIHYAVGLSVHWARCGRPQMGANHGKSSSRCPHTCDPSTSW